MELVHSKELLQVPLNQVQSSKIMQNTSLRKRCMDLISIESAEEQNFLGRVMGAGNVREVWTSGR